MRTIITLVFITLVSFSTNAQTVIAQSTTKTVGGIGGYTDVVQPFKAGDKISIQATASKLLSSFTVFQSNHNVLGKLKDLKKISYTFTVPTDDSIKFHFVTDRGGSTTINYTITKLN